MRLFELASQLGARSSDLLRLAREKELEIATAASAVDEEDAAVLRGAFLLPPVAKATAVSEALAAKRLAAAEIVRASIAADAGALDAARDRAAAFLTFVHPLDGEAAPAPAAPASVPSPAPAEPRTQDYKVKPGDNLTRLARNAGTTPAELARLNGVDEKELAKLKVGQTIKLPVVD